MPTVTVKKNAVDQWVAFAEEGLTVSICCGPSGRQEGWCWSVQVLSRDGQAFDRPFAANSLAHALEIAALEVRRRGW